MLPARWATMNMRMLTAIGAPEAAAIGVAAVASIAASLILLPDARGVAGSGLALLMIAIAAVDARIFIIPDELTIAALILGLAHTWLQGADAALLALAHATLRGALLALAFLALRTAYRRVRGREGIGLGDVKLAGAAGIWLDLATIPIAIEVAALAALAVCAVRYFRDGAALRSTTRLPFGLFFAPSIWLGWLLGSTLLAAPAGSFFP